MKKYTRKFLGEITDLKKERNPNIRNFNKAHLKAYLSGREFFKFGYKTLESGERVPSFYMVQKEYKEI